ncbi:MAG: flavodoxin-dependent (E)-4-hydroxy-3-methylbut-2-enyl-diphosphate synthase, partial [SAR324 cluster bacterium]|nr:flavodoxin-dependent (E)-4-hydroxy-3-methylbut-2-enyl-diphosphate synthase [SAR324 cluster bacterium]
VQSMCATKTQDIKATLAQINSLQEHGADIIRIAVDSRKDVEALAEIRKNTDARLVVDLQENYRLATLLAPYVQKIRYNPGHLFHHEKHISVKEKVAFLVEVARKHNLAIRIGINSGSIDPALKNLGKKDFAAALSSAREHVAIMEDLKFENYLLSLKSSDPNEVIEINEAFAKEYPFIPLHLGVTEAGMLPMGEAKTRLAFENLLARGIGETLRVSLTLPHAEKFREVEIGRQIIEDVYSGRFKSTPRFAHNGLNIISCPSCSRVENEAFIQLAEKVRDMAAFASSEKITIAIMGCRVNGPGETDDADLGLWCAPNHVNLKRKGQLIGVFSYEEILEQTRQQLLQLIDTRKNKHVL